MGRSAGTRPGIRGKFQSVSPMFQHLLDAVGAFGKFRYRHNRAPFEKRLRPVQGHIGVMERGDHDWRRLRYRCPAVARTASNRTEQPRLACPGRMFSAGLWLMPPSQGMKIMAVGTTRAM